MTVNGQTQNEIGSCQILGTDIFNLCETQTITRVLKRMTSAAGLYFHLVKGGINIANNLNICKLKAKVNAVRKINIII